MSRFRKSSDPEDDDDMADSPSSYAPHGDPRDEPPIDAEIVDDDPLPPPPPPLSTPLPTGQPLLVTVTQLQGTVSELQQDVREQLAEIARRLDAIDSLAAAAAAPPPPPPPPPAVEPPWVGRLETAIEGVGSSAAVSTAAALATMGDQHTSDLASVRQRLDELQAATTSAASAAASASDDGTARELAAAVARLCDDLASFTEEIRRSFAELSQGLAHARAGASNDAVIAHLVDIRAALRLLVG